MNPMMVKKLIERDVIRQGTEIEANYHAHGLSCQNNAFIRGLFSIQSASVIQDGTKVIFTGRSTDTGVIYRFPSEQIVALDGMTASRLAGIYNITETGEDVKQGKRRGRRSKAMIEAMAEAARLAAEDEEDVAA